MAPYSKPETVLKQAEGLISVGQSHAALQSLTEMFSSKRFRSTPLASLEPIMLRYIELCVDMRKGRTAKEGLMQYKNIAQNTSVASVEVVIKYFVQLADQKVQEAQEKADKAVALTDVDDLEASETPESILLGAVSGDQNRDRTDRALVTPWLKFLWESYRTALETLKNNARLEVIYQQVAQQAFKFCLKHVRKVEFRRLCETLRLHLANVAKYAHQPHSINLSDPDTLQHHLDTRFAQLNTSVELELWQEAFRSIEDIHNLLTMAKKAPRPAMMANYYEKLARIFLTSGNALFHAAAWSKYYAIVRTSGGKTDEDLSKLAGLVLISVLAVPMTVEPEEDLEDGKSRASKLSALLNLPKMPTRAGLLNEALSRNTLKMSLDSVRTLYDILEASFDPLTICERVAPVFKELSADESYAPYLPLLNKVVVSRLLSQLSEVYSSIKLSYLNTLIEPLNKAELQDATSDAPETSKAGSWDEDKLESFLMSAARRGELPVRVDHAHGTLTFIASLFGATSPTVQPSPGAFIVSRVSTLATTLHNTVQTLYPTPQISPEEKFQDLVSAAQAERRAIQIRQSIVARRRELLSELSVRKEKEEAIIRAEQARRDKEAQAKRAVEELKQREMERVKKSIEQTRAEEVRKLAEALKSSLKAPIEVLDTTDPDTLIRMQVDQIEKEKRERNEKVRVIAKRIDHLERAYRKEERPLLEQDYEGQQADDRAAYEVTVQTQLQASKEKFALDMATKKRVSRMMHDYEARRAAIMAKRDEEFKKRQAAAQKKIDEEKAKRRAEVLKEREEEMRKLEEEERRIREAEEEERRKEEALRAEEERRLAEEEATRAAAEKEAREEEEKRDAERKRRQAEREAAMEAARLQAQREEEAMRRREERRAAEKGGREASAPVGASAWRRGATPAVPVRAAAPSVPAVPVRSAASSIAARSGTISPRAGESPATPSTGRPSLFGGKAATGGGWREREAAKKAAGASGTASPSGADGARSGEGTAPTAPAPTGEDDGFQSVPKRNVWRPTRGRGI
ncbi:hypothetical protein M422DRAFT_29646 [Sphaerobolus stellatus SS14]|uniref:Eukaryotic translation initiation factor 3 subunit A n=1 Tax=Sphaerobolus stellatus (strain SS14) TaxID=990650 RepID=A0A0C9VES7_SPHS4|nr:hypothetical protein M422DRAFT_29646 [Sphaerobolus stellatus SS14]